MITLVFDPLADYNFIIEASVILILSFFFGEISKRTNIPSVLMLIVLGIIINYVLQYAGITNMDLSEPLSILGIVGLIMIVLEAALELELKREKAIPIIKALGIALIGLLLSTYAAAFILEYFIEGMDSGSSWLGISGRAWLYATPLSILSSAIIIPSVAGLKEEKKEFHVYESTFSDILGIMLFYFLSGEMDAAQHSAGFTGFLLNVVLTVVLSLVASYLIIIIFQRIQSHVKLFLLIAVLLLLYSLGKKMHLSSLIIILIFGLLIANMKLFFSGPLKQFLDKKHADEIYEGLHVVTMETAFVVRTFFFVIFGTTIVLSSLASVNVALVSLLIILSIYLIRFIILKISIGGDIIPQLYIAPRGLITILLFYAIPKNLQVAGFNEGILLFIIIGTSIIMTIALIYDKKRTNASINKVKSKPVNYVKWKAPSVDDIK
jgi:cell volume regulation protein A